MENLIAVVPRPVARNDVEEPIPVFGWVTFSIAVVAVIVSLYSRCKNFFV